MSNIAEQLRELFRESFSARQRLLIRAAIDEIEALSERVRQLEAMHNVEFEELPENYGSEYVKKTATYTPPASDEQTTNTYVLDVPDHCDRIKWRGSYYHLPPTSAEGLDKNMVLEVLKATLNLNETSEFASFLRFDIKCIESGKFDIKQGGDA